MVCTIPVPEGVELFGTRGKYSSKMLAALLRSPVSSRRDSSSAYAANNTSALRTRAATKSARRRKEDLRKLVLRQRETANRQRARKRIGRLRPGEGGETVKEKRRKGNTGEKEGRADETCKRGEPKKREGGAIGKGGGCPSRRPKGEDPEHRASRARDASARRQRGELERWERPTLRTGASSDQGGQPGHRGAPSSGCHYESRSPVLSASGGGAEIRRGLPGKVHEKLARSYRRVASLRTSRR